MDGMDEMDEMDEMDGMDGARRIAELDKQIVRPGSRTI